MYRLLLTLYKKLMKKGWKTRTQIVNTMYQQGSISNILHVVDCDYDISIIQ